MTEPLTIKTYRLEQIFANPHNVRDNLGTPDNIDELAASIRKYGLIQPIVITDHPTREGDYMLIAGHRRVAAAKKAGLLELPAIYTTAFTEEGEQIAAMLTENLHREQVTPVEEARAVQAMLDLPGYTVEKVADAISKSASTIRRRAQLIQAGEKVLDAVQAKEIDLFQAEEISKYSAEPDLAEKLFNVAESSKGWEWTMALGSAEHTLNWRQKLDKATAHLASLGYKVISQEQIKELGLYQLPTSQIYGLPVSINDALELSSYQLSEGLYKEYGATDIYVYFNSNSQRLQWYILKTEQEEPEQGPTAEELAEQEAREKAELALRVELPHFEKNLKELAGQPGKLKGTAQAALLEVITRMGLGHASILLFLGIDYDPNDEESRKQADKKLAACTVDQLAYALLAVQVLGVERGLKDLYKLDSYNPSGYYAKQVTGLNQLLADIYGIQESEAIRQAKAFWEPALPGTETSTEDEVNF